MNQLTHSDMMNMYYLSVQLLISVTDGYFSNNAGLTEFPTDIQNTDSTLSLNGNSISSVPHEAFLGFTILHTISMRKNSLVNIPNVVPISGTIRELDLYDNR